MKAADDAIFFKRIVKGVARKHGLAATFMAKPYGTRSGNGMHIHFSLLDADGNNVFNDGSDEGIGGPQECRRGPAARHAGNDAYVCAAFQFLPSAAAGYARADRRVLGL